MMILNYESKKELKEYLIYQYGDWEDDYSNEERE